MFKKAKNSFLGRALRRLLGEETGAVMMEYIVIALLIAAAAVVAVGVFGSATGGMFAVLTQTLTNQTDDGMKNLKENVRPGANSGIQAGQAHINDDINPNNAGVKDNTNWGGSTN